MSLPLSFFLSFFEGQQHSICGHLTGSPGDEWWCGPRGADHHFKTHQRLGTKEGEARGGRTGSYYTGGKHALHLAHQQQQKEIEGVKPGVRPRVGFFCVKLLTFAADATH